MIKCSWYCMLLLFVIQLKVISFERSIHFDNFDFVCGRLSCCGRRPGLLLMKCGQYFNQPTALLTLNRKCGLHCTAIYCKGNTFFKTCNLRKPINRIKIARIDQKSPRVKIDHQLCDYYNCFISFNEKLRKRAYKRQTIFKKQQFSTRHVGAVVFSCAHRRTLAKQRKERVF